MEMWKVELRTDELGNLQEVSWYMDDDYTHEFEVNIKKPEMVLLDISYITLPKEDIIVPCPVLDGVISKCCLAKIVISMNANWYVCSECGRLLENGDTIDTRED